MNIKFAKNVRIRLSEEDVQSWKSNKRLVEVFRVGSMMFEVDIFLGNMATKSFLQSGDYKLMIGLTQEDSESLFIYSDHLGIDVSGIKLQIDQWSEDKRSRIEQKRSRGAE